MEHARPVVVLDFGSQYTQLIARRIREMQVYALIVPCHTPFDEIVALKPQALVLSGGPSSVYDTAAPVCDERVLKLKVPVLGVCYGLQWISRTLGGRVEPARRREYGFAQLEIHPTSKLSKASNPRCASGTATVTTLRKCRRGSRLPGGRKTPFR